ncbi:MAG: Stf0 family sulfotransferase [Pseudomonadota bacterium]
MTNYILCTSPRSGSTLLCDLLWQTGVAGKPNSFFRPQSIPNWCDRWGLTPTTITTFDQTYLATAITKGAMGTGTFGLRIMHNNLAPLLGRLKEMFGQTNDVAVLTEAFGPLKFLHLNRSDKVAQAVSLAMAEQTGLWHKNADGSDRENFHLAPEPTYTYESVAHELKILTDEAKGWPSWFAANSVTPLYVDYETLSQRPTETLSEILVFLGKDPQNASKAKPGTQKLASAINDTWAKRFRAEAGLPPPALRS